MKLAALTAIASLLAALAASSTAHAQDGVDWTSVTSGTLGSSAVTATGFSTGSTISQSDFSTSFYSAAPLSATQSSVNYHAYDDWSVDFAPAVSGGVLWYGSFIRGAGAFPTGQDTEYTFNHPPVIVSGFAQGSVSGNTFTLPDSIFHWGILSFSGTIDTLTCTTNATGISFQTCTIAAFPPPPLVGTNYCMPNLNSTGVAGTLFAQGSAIVANNDLTLTATNLPNNAFGFFVVSPDQGFVMNPGGSSGNLCLSGAIGRYVGPGQIQNTGTVGLFSLVLDLTAVPSPSGSVATMSGDTWNFQGWFRDTNAAGATSNFTDGLEILFL